MKKPVIMIGLPNRGRIESETTVCLMDLSVSLFARKINFYKMNVHDRVEWGRNTVVDAAISANCTHVLFVDSDATFPANGCEILLAHDKKIVGATTAGKMTDLPVVKECAEGKPMDYTSGGLVHVNAIGMHFTLIKIEVFHEMGKPWFYAKHVDGYSRGHSEDYTFCKNARHGYGINTYCDIDLTMKVGHVRYRTDVAYIDPAKSKQMDYIREKAKEINALMEKMSPEERKTHDTVAEGIRKNMADGDTLEEAIEKGIKQRKQMEEQK
jgi:hypothetical protein